MSKLKGKIDFVAIVSAENANPNGDPLNGNMPRDNFDGYGEISDVCIKRKIRNRLQDLGCKIFVQTDERSDDGFTSLADRADGCAEFKTESAKGKKANKKMCEEIACKEWMDVRSFGQVFAFKSKKSSDKDVKEGKSGKEDGVSIGVRGPVSIHQAVSVSPVEIISMQITKSVNGDSGSEGKKTSDTMGTKHRVKFGLYVIKGSINCQLAEKTGFSNEDADLIKESLRTLFENDTSSARPDGSMEVCKLYWWQHNEATPAVSSAKVHKSVIIKPKDENIVPKCFDDYEVNLASLDCVKPEIL